MIQKQIKANYIDIAAKHIFPAQISIKNGIIESITPISEPCTTYILPGFIDSHIHIESSMLPPSQFARLALRHGTVATISDPHEIANVCGLDGVKLMIEDGKRVPFHFFFGAPSCVPATSFETSGANLGIEDVEEMLSWPDIWYLSEMMNYPGVLFDNPEVLAKIQASHKANKPVDGHAPGLRAEDARKYASAGISTDHECFTYNEALEKIGYGMKILIREGSAARNFEALYPLIDEFPYKVMLCSDDKHPDELINGHINQLVARGIAKGLDLFNLLQAACLNPISHYKLPVGKLQVNEPADFIVIKDLIQFEVLETWIKGEKVAENNQELFTITPAKVINNFSCNPKKPSDFFIYEESATVRVIDCLDGQLITKESTHLLQSINGVLQSDQEYDILFIAVVNRYNEAKITTAFIRNFGLKNAAVASSVAHDSHNIVVVGTSYELIAKAINGIIANRGGVSYADEFTLECLPLEIGGLMSSLTAEEVSILYSSIDLKAKKAGSTLRAPYMSLSFMALLVIPQLKISDLGLFDGSTFTFTSLLNKNEQA